MNILAIDPGTKCGWAISALESGVWDLGAQRHEGGGMRFVRLRNYLCKLTDYDIVPMASLDQSDVKALSPNMIVYEEVNRHLGTAAAHVYGGIIAIIQEHCESLDIPYKGIPVQTIKKHATGKGNANKEAMIEAARKFYQDADIVDDNHADALCLLHYATEHFGG